MTARALHDWLLDLGSAAPRDPLPAFDLEVSTPAQVPTEDPDASERAALNSAREDAQAAVRAELGRHYEARLAEQAQDFEDRLAAARADWTVTRAEALASALDGALDALEERIGEQVATILAPFLEGAVRRRVLDTLVARIESLLAAEDAPLVKMRGPQDLLDAVRLRLGTRIRAVTYEPSDGPELQVTIADTLIETRLAAWADALRAEAA